MGCILTCYGASGAPASISRDTCNFISPGCTPTPGQPRGGARRTFLINQRIFDRNRVDLVSDVGRVDTWEITNDTAMAHPFHIHGTQFQLVSRRLGTQVTPAPYLAWIDTMLIPSQQAVTIKVRHTSAGKRMFHCHILEHEDNCMMAILDVRPASA